MKPEVGMYVRFKDKRENQFIRRIIDIPKDNRYASIYLDKEANYVTGVSLKNVIKASHNIIDLIEEGDYVNGHQVYEIDRECHRITLNGGDNEEGFRLTYLRPALGKNMGIKSVVTKEQFNVMKYEV